MGVSCDRDISAVANRRPGRLRVRLEMCRWAKDEKRKVLLGRSTVEWHPVSAVGPLGSLGPNAMGC